jgi:protein ImuB
VSAPALSIAPAVLSPRTAKQIERAKETERILSILHQWGIHTLGQLAALSRDDLAARLGMRAVELWERANGRAKRILKLVSPPESFIESFEFENEIETAEPLLFILRRFLQQLATRLHAIYLVAKELRLRITFRDKSHYERVFKIPQPTNNEDILFRMLHTHLENFTSKHPIVAIELEAQPSRSVRQQFGLFETALRDPVQLHETLARLVGLLGADRVGTPVLEETHRPDAFRTEPFAWELGPCRFRLVGAYSSERTGVFARRDEENGPHPTLSSALTGAARPSLPAGERERRACDSTAVREHIPLRRFRKRTKATVLLENNRPAHVRTAEVRARHGTSPSDWRTGLAVEGATVTEEGPFPLSGNWWDERAWARVEWDVEIENGVIARCHCDQDGWAIDGIYD